MARKLLIIGAGYTGLRVAERAVPNGWAVTGTTRSPDRAAALERVGARALDWSTSDGIDALPIDHETDVVYSVPTADDVSAETIVEIAGRCRRFVLLSSASVYGNHDGAEIDEDSDRRATSPAGKARLDIENALFDSGHDALIVRIVGIYGPGRTLDRYLASGRYKLVDGGTKVTNRIHVDDLATIVIAAVDRAPRGPRAYLAADGQPTRVCDLIDWLVEHRGIPRPEEIALAQYRVDRGDDAADRWANSYSATNRRVIEELGVELAYPTVFDGYRAIFG